MAVTAKFAGEWDMPRMQEQFAAPPAGSTHAKNAGAFFDVVWGGATHARIQEQFSASLGQSMVMPTRPMHVSVLALFIARLTHLDHLDGEVQRLARHRVIQIDVYNA